MSLKYLSTNITSDQCFWTGMIAGIAGFCPKVIDIFMPINEYVVYFGVISNFIVFHLCMFLSYRTLILERKAKWIKDFRETMVATLKIRYYNHWKYSLVYMRCAIENHVPELRAIAVKIGDEEAVHLLDLIHDKLAKQYFLRQIGR